MTRAYVGIHQLVSLQGDPGPRRGPSLSELGIIEDAVVITEASQPGQETIRMVGTYHELSQVVKDCDDELDCDGVGIPAFVDAHTHIVWGGNRLDDFERRIQGQSYREIAEAGGGILSTVRQTRKASQGELLETAAERAFDMVSLGTAVAEIKSGYGLDLDTEARMLGVAGRLQPVPLLHVSRTYLGLHALPPEYPQREEYVRYCLETVLPELVHHRLVNAVDIFVEPGYFTESDAMRLAAAATKYGLPLRMHVDQMSNHHGASLAARLGARTADHLEHTDAEGIGAMASAGVIPVLLPTSVFCLGLSRYPDARAMIDAGLPVVLATDYNPGSSPCPSMAMVHATACTQMRMTPAECLTASTLNAAHALGIDGQFGSIEPGKRMAMTVLDTRDYRELAYNVGNNLVVGVCGSVSGDDGDPGYNAGFSLS